MKAIKEGDKVNFDTIYNKLPSDRKLIVTNDALSTVQQELSDLDFKSMMTSDADYIIRQHDIEAIRKFTLALSCLIFFFIGAPLGAIIRKGGLGIPVIISVLVLLPSSSLTTLDSEWHEAECGQYGSAWDLLLPFYHHWQSS